jgi:predicted enzyme related to lactoylglutathione lyase
MAEDLQRFPVYAYIPAQDLARARRFYEDRLGLVAQQETQGGVVYTFAGGTACFLYPTPNAGTSKASQLFWDVKGIEGLVAALKARGIAFERYDVPGGEVSGDIVTAGGAKAAWFKDSEGNIMALVESLA